MQVLYDEINQKTREAFTDEQLCSVSTATIFSKWFEVAEAKRQELLSEGLAESAKELDGMIQVQKKKKFT